MKCVRCSVSLTFHKNRNQMICHYCGYRTQPAEVCPQCDSLDIGYSGFGTERIEEEIKGILPGLSVKRIDTDAVRKKRELGKVLSDFRKGEIDILLGTQMVAKGLNFPGVKLVGIVSADAGLQLPDFRALERTFSLIVQVSGRAGRMTPDGKVMIQTLKPENSVLLKAARMQLEEFYREELAMRKKLLFPPYFRIIRLVFRGKNRQNVQEAAGELGKLLKSSLQCSQLQVECLGPVECPLSVISGNHRFHVIIRGKNFSAAHAAVRSRLSQYKIPRGIYLEVDVDPLSLL